MNRFIRVLQKDIVTKPEEWKYAGPGKFIMLSDRAKNVYCVLSVIAYSTAGNVKDSVVQGGHKLGSSWFWTSHTLLQQLTGACQKTVQRGIRELQEEEFIDYYPAKKQGQRCFFKIKRIKYNTKQEYVPDIRVKPKLVEDEEPTLPGDEDIDRRDVLTSHPKLTVWDEDEPILPGDEEAIEEAMEIKKKMGDEAYLKYMFNNSLEFYLTPEDREKYSELKN